MTRWSVSRMAPKLSPEDQQKLDKCDTELSITSRRESVLQRARWSASRMAQKLSPENQQKLDQRDAGPKMNRFDARHGRSSDDVAGKMSGRTWRSVSFNRRQLFRWLEVIPMYGPFLRAASQVLIDDTDVVTEPIITELTLR
ncbi:hypothetical protein CDEST_00123 [Colletotrichum destructivum]|uniref:Uncharacterized protein n=1 Tax=Colletotrichum destructivum TaxID=34406 RepID=A0AAX4HVQ2_9PEZI|nr:hypothetical protein CDEST_00123 [Colletotrichum destructivum]